MTYQERRSIILAIATLISSIIYYSIMKNRLITPGLEQVELLKQWAKFVVFFIPVQIVITIVVTILNNILANIFDGIKNGGELTENDYEVVDEYEKYVELKALQISTSIFAITIFSGITLLIFTVPIAYMFQTFFIGTVLTGISFELAKLFYYRRGV